jgi:hypothetical protein
LPVFMPGGASRAPTNPVFSASMQRKREVDTNPK